MGADKKAAEEAAKQAAAIEAAAAKVTPALDEALSALTPAQIAELMMTRKRRLDHAAAKASQPVAGVAGASMGVLRDALFAPMEADPTPFAGLDLLLLTACDCANGSAAEDLVFALVRVARKAWAMNAHLGAIEAQRQG